MIFISGHASTVDSNARKNLLMAFDVYLNSNIYMCVKAYIMIIIAILEHSNAYISAMHCSGLCVMEEISSGLSGACIQSIGEH